MESCDDHIAAGDFGQTLELVDGSPLLCRLFLLPLRGKVNRVGGAPGLEATPSTQLRMGHPGSALVTPEARLVLREQ